MHIHIIHTYATSHTHIPPWTHNTHIIHTSTHTYHADAHTTYTYTHHTFINTYIHITHTHLHTPHTHTLAAPYTQSPKNMHKKDHRKKVLGASYKIWNYFPQNYKWFYWDNINITLHTSCLSSPPPYIRMSWEEDSLLWQIYPLD